MTNLPEKLDTLEKVGELYLKSYKPAEIARRLNISPAQAKAYIEDYKVVVDKKFQNDPEFLDRIGENTLVAIERMEAIVAETWETYEYAKDNEMINQQINLLKLSATHEQQLSNLLQLAGAKVDSGMMARMQKAERVNEIVTRVIKEVSGDCPKCRHEVMARLAEAFELMNKQAEAVEMRELAPESEIIEAEVIEGMTEEEEAAMMADILSED
jgi:hypothetical protein